MLRPFRLLCAVVLAASSLGCWTQERAVSLLDVREKALQQKDPARVLAYDDVILEISELDDAERALLRNDRTEQFRKLIELELPKIGALTPETAPKHLAQLLAFREELSRVPGERLADLLPVNKDLIPERIGKVAEVMWPDVEALVAREHFFEALRKGAPIVAELPPEHPYRARLTAIRRQAADKHIAISARATDTQFGAKLLHARIAAFFGGTPGDLSGAQIELDKLRQLIFEVNATGSCADVEVRLKKDLAPEHGQPAKLSLSINRCTESPREWKTAERGSYTVSQEATEKVSIGKASKTVCSGSVEGTYRQSSTVGNTTTTSDVSTGSRNTGCQLVEEEQFIERAITIQKEEFEDYTAEHASHDISLSGAFRIELDGRVSEGPFSISRSSSDTWWTTSHVPSRPRGGDVRQQARDLAYSELKGAIRKGAEVLLAETAARFAREGDSASAEARALDAEHAWFIAAAMGTPYQGKFADHMRSTYAMGAEEYSVAIHGGELRNANIRGDASVKLPEVPATEIAEERRFQERHGLQYDDFRSMFNGSITFGPMQWRRDDARGGTLTGGLGSLSIAFVMPAPPVFSYGGQARLTGGVDETGTGMMDVDFIGIGGLQVKGFHLEPVVGLGFNFTTNTNEGPEGNEHYLPAGAYVEYGARFSYAFSVPVTVELLYTKAYRTDATIQSERRADARLTVIPFSLSIRYTEQMAESDFFFASFGSGEPAARLIWLLGGFGI